MKSEVVETKQARFWVDEDNVFNVDYKNLESIQIEHSINEIETCISMSRSLPALAVVDISSVKSVSSESRDLYSSEKSVKVFKAVGLIARTPISRVLGNFFLGINRPPVPIKLFNDKDTAIGWLKSMS